MTMTKQEIEELRRVEREASRANVMELRAELEKRAVLARELRRARATGEDFAARAKRLTMMHQNAWSRIGGRI